MALLSLSRSFWFASALLSTRFRCFPCRTFARPAPSPAFASFVVMKDFKFFVRSKSLHVGSIPMTTAVDCVRSGRLTHIVAWFLLMWCIMKTLEYPLMATSLSKKQCDIIMKLIFDSGLSALGISQTMNRDTVYGPHRFQGVGVPDLWMLQGILKLWITIAHGDANTITGSSLRAILALHTIELELLGSFLSHDYNKYSHLATNTWLKHLWHFCHKSNIQLEPSTLPIPLACENDVFLMNELHALDYSADELYHLNVCRLWCHSVHLSDITTGDGLHIHSMAGNGQVSNDAGCEFVWPAHGRPTPKWWKL
jgi:hypothetical protein